MSDDRAWHHAILTTYGAWLPGDKRGFRTLHHREHVEGDYRSPLPTGVYEGLAKYSRKALNQPPVVLPEYLRGLVGNELRNRLALLNCWVLCCAVAKQHVHLLVKLRADEARNHLGLAKKQVTCALRQQGWTGNVWAAKGKVDRIRSREHQVATYRYILRHERERAWIGKWRDDPASQT